MNDILDSVTLKDLIYFIVGIITIISVFVEKMKSLPFKPWTKLFEWLGKCLTKSLDEKLEKIDEQQQTYNNEIKELKETMDRRFEEKQRDDDEKEAKRLRTNIIEFADSCRIGNHHTQKHFENVMRNYGDYERYCRKHKIPNHFIDSEYKYIEDVYQECLRENKFL